jgi:hypothetical protein
LCRRAPPLEVREGLERRSYIASFEQCRAEVANITSGGEK